MRKKTYPSDTSRERFEQICPLLEQSRKRTKPRTVDLYEVWCAVLYLLRTGRQWRALPSDFPKWRTVHSYLAQWSELDECNRAIGRLLREHVLGHAMSLGCATVQWQTPSWNEHAARFYRRLGASESTKLRHVLPLSRI